MKPAERTKLAETTQRMDEAAGVLRSVAKGAKELAKHGWGKAHMTLAFTKHLAEAAAQVLPAAQKYVRAVERLDVARTRSLQEIDLILDGFRALDGATRQAVNRLLKDSTESGLWAYQPEGQPSAQVDTELAARFDNLPQKAQLVVREVFAHGQRSLQELRDAATGSVNAEFDGQIAQAVADGDADMAKRLQERKAQATKKFETLLKVDASRPYAPLKRFGNHVVVGMSQAYLDAEAEGNQGRMQELQGDPAHYFVAFRETAREAQRLRDSISGTFAYADGFERSQAQQKLFGGRDMLGAFGRLRKLIDESEDAGFKGKAGQAVSQAMSDLYLSLLAENSARVSEHQRLNVAGADEDMMRSFVTRGRAVGQFVANLQGNDAVTEALAEMNRQVRERKPGRSERQGFFNELLARHVMGMTNDQTPVVDKALSFSSLWMLISSPAHFVVNMTQPWAMSLPTMMGRYHAKAPAALMQAYTEVAPMLRDGRITGDEYGKLPKDVAHLVQRLVDRGVIDISLRTELGGWRSHDDTGVSAAFGRVTDKLRGVAQTVESLNRVTTAMAALRLQLAEGRTEDQAVEYAAKIINDTHGDYSGFNAPRFMRTGIGRVMTQFRKFQLIQLSMFAKLAHGAFKGATVQERAAARYALGYNFAAMAALGGAVGVPAAEAAGALLRAIFGDDDDPRDAEQWLRDAAGGGTLATVLTRGLPAAVGWDISKRVGAGDMLSLFPYADWGLDDRKGYEALLGAAAGPLLGGILPNMADGVSLLGEGQVLKALEKLMPKGVADALKAGREAKQGVTDRKGVQLVEVEDMAFFDSALQLVGFRSTEAGQRSKRSSDTFKAQEHFNTRTAQVKKDYVKAHAAGEHAKALAIRQEWAALQEARVRAGFSRQPLSVLLKAPREAAKQGQFVRDGVKYNRGTVARSELLN